MTEQHDDLELIDLLSATTEGDGRGGRSPRGGRQASGGRRGLPVWALAGLVVLGVLSLWALLAYLRLDAVRDDLFDARATLDQAVTAVNDGDLPAAGALLRESAVTFDSVPGRVTGPLVAPVRLVPSVRRTLDAVAQLARGAGTVAVAGVDISEVLDADGGGLGALAPQDGRMPITALQALAPALADARDAIAEARAIVEAVPTDGIDGQVVQAREEFLTTVDPLAEQIDAGTRVTRVLPGLFGAEGARRYMVVASNPAEARGTGGFFGAYTIMEADDGVLSFSDVTHTQELPILPRGQIPWPDESLEERYDAYGGTGQIVNLNMTPDFPSAATALENYYAAATGETLDGVIAVDPYAFESLLRIAGPVEVPGYGSVGPDEVVDFVLRDAYSVITDPGERKGLIGLVATSALQGFLSSPEGVGARQVLSALAEMVARDSIMVHATDPEEQAVLDELGVAGRLAADGGGDLVGVFLNSGSPSKVDYWLERQIRYDVVLGPDGASSGILAAGFVNGAPTTGELIYMIGGGLPPLDPGDVLELVSAYCPPGCTFHETPDAGFDDLTTDLGEELGFGVASTWMRLPSMRARELVWSYTTPGAWEQRGAERVYVLDYQHQTAPRPTGLQVNVRIPDGHVATQLPPDAVVEDGQVSVSLSATTDQQLTFTFAPTPS